MDKRKSGHASGKEDKNSSFGNSPLFEDLSRVAGNAFGAFASARQEIEVRVKEQFENFAAKFDMVRREEFEAVKQMAAKAREEQEKLAAKLAELEKKVKGK